MEAADTLLTLAEVYLLGIGAFLGLGSLIAQICNALGVGPLTIFGVYLLGLILYLVFAATQFTRMLFVRPGGS